MINMFYQCAYVGFVHKSKSSVLLRYKHIRDAVFIYPESNMANHNSFSNRLNLSSVWGLGTAVAQWLRCCATNRKVAGSIPAGVSGFFIDIKSFRSHYGTGVDSASNRNEYQEYFLGVKAAGA